MTPADLAELLRGTATAVLTEHGLDPAVLPAMLELVNGTAPPPYPGGDTIPADFLRWFYLLTPEKLALRKQANQAAGAGDE